MSVSETFALAKAYDLLKPGVVYTYSDLCKLVEDAEEDAWGQHPDEDDSKAWERYVEGGWDVTGAYAHEEREAGVYHL